MKSEKTTETRRISILGMSPNFAGLDDAGLRALAKVSLLREYAEGEYLFQQDEPATGFHVLIDGAVNVQRVGVDGRQQVLHVFEGGGAPCGEVAVFEGTTYPAAAVATAPTRTRYLPRDEFIGVVRQHPEILLKMLATLSRRLRRFVGLIDDLALKDVSARLARHLLELAEVAGGDQIELETTKVVLASRLGTVAETLSRTLRKMQRKKLIVVDGRRITILDEDGLQDIADGVGS
jgi:CRP/FNR family transcriptional regulator